MPDSAPRDTPKWGIVSTLKADARDILNFAAYHLNLGAHRLYLYLDSPCPDAVKHLKAHPKIRITETGDAYWRKKGGRPAKHQPRQTINAADAYAKRVEVDWLTHIDVDEFLLSDTPLPRLLADLPAECLCARIRPIEKLAQSDDLYKSFALPMPQRRAITTDIYPTYGRYLNGGFLSHVAGKMIYRTGLEGFSVKIHNAFQGAVQNPGQVELKNVKLCHHHASDWDSWFAHFAYRHAQGAYRAELQAPFDKDNGGLSMHDLLGGIYERHAEAGLRAFFDEVCTARPTLLADLERHDLLYRAELNLAAKRETVFPEFA